MVGLTLILIVTVLYGVVAGVRWLWSRRRKRARGHRSPAPMPSS
jgi:H+/Cl- antiporter ClcA